MNPLYCRFNLPANYDYCGPPPREHFYDRLMDEEQKEDVDEYLDAFEGDWCFRSCMHEYLVQDVRMLRDGCLALLKEFFEFQQSLSREVTIPFHAFTNFITASSLSHALYRFYALEDGDIYLVSNQNNARRTSQSEREFLEYESHCRGEEILTVYNSPEGQVKVRSNGASGSSSSSARGGAFFHADGYAPRSNTIFEFNVSIFTYFLPLSFLQNKVCLFPFLAGLHVPWPFTRRSHVPPLGGSRGDPLQGTAGGGLPALAAEAGPHPDGGV